jgi:hypothetical protein
MTYKTLALTLLLAFPAISIADPVGMVVALRGDVVAREKQLQQGDQIYEEDEIVTAARSFAVVHFHDGAKVTIRPDSTLIVEQYTQENATLELVTGGLRIITGSMAKTNPENYMLKTPVALMGVRGTEFAILLVPDAP